MYASLDWTINNFTPIKYLFVVITNDHTQFTFLWELIFCLILFVQTTENTCICSLELLVEVFNNSLFSTVASRVKNDDPRCVLCIPYHHDNLGGSPTLSFGLIQTTRKPLKRTLWTAFDFGDKSFRGSKGPFWPSTCKHKNLCLGRGEWKVNF